MDPIAALGDALGFALKGLIVFLTFAGCAIMAAAAVRGSRRKRSVGNIEVTPLGDELKNNVDAIHRATMDAKSYQKLQKTRRAEYKALQKGKGPPPPPNTIYVINFKGDIVASAVGSLREEITTIISVASEADEVVVLLESAGGAAHSYGLAAAQLARIRERKIRLTVCIDKVAASGGYMMACVAQHIVAAPFAIVGSIGVAAPVPNLHRLLDKVGVDYENVTAGEYKRTVSFLGEITDKGRAKFQEQIDETHDLFKQWVGDNRPSLDMDVVATGEHWHGLRALELRLVDELETSDDYLLSKLDTSAIYEVSYEHPTTLRDRITGSVSMAAEKLIVSLWSRIHQERPTG